ncbi:MAG: hypothetical protein JXB30_11640 [Anaerolineae bacterium]|nr:hypothetical protein [Anaerolineae bacterium]
MRAEQLHWQFQYIREQRAKHLSAGCPVISVDAKKKELMGNFKNAERIWCQEAEVVNVYDFPQNAIGRAIPEQSPSIYDRHSLGLAALDLVSSSTLPRLGPLSNISSYFTIR